MERRGLGRGRFAGERRGILLENRDHDRRFQGRVDSDVRRGWRDYHFNHRERGDYRSNQSLRPNLKVSSYKRQSHVYPKTQLTHGISGRGILGPRPSVPESSLHLPHVFKKPFSSLFSKPSSSNLPPVSQIKQADEEGWIKVVNRRRLPKARKSLLSRPSPPISRCFYCGDPRHIAKVCKMGAFVCFKCNGVGHIARECPTSIRAIPTLPLPDIIKDQIEALSSCAIFYVCKGSPSLSELKEMMDFKFNVKGWPHRVSRAAGNSFLVQFPDEEMIDQAENMKLVDMGNFKGRFLRWREDLGFKLIPEPFLTWVKLDHLPYHLWDWEFLQILFKDIGECIACSKDVAFHSHFANCKVLLKVRDLSLIPPEVRFRCLSPFDNSMLEGYATLKVIRKKIKENDFIENVEIRDHELKWEGEESSSSGWVDRGSDMEVLQPPPVTSKVQSSEEDVVKMKGKRVISYFSNSKETGYQAPSKEKSVPINLQRNQFQFPPLAPPQSAGINDDPDLIQVYWNGNQLTVDRTQWEDFLRIQGVGGSSLPRQHIAPTQHTSSDSSSKAISDSAKAGSNSVSLPPGFENFAKDVKKKKIRSSRLVAKPLSAKKFGKYLAASRSRSASGTKG